MAFCPSILRFFVAKRDREVRWWRDHGRSNHTGEDLLLFRKITLACCHEDINDCHGVHDEPRVNAGRTTMARSILIVAPVDPQDGLWRRLADSGQSGGS